MIRHDVNSRYGPITQMTLIDTSFYIYVHTHTHTQIYMYISYKAKGFILYCMFESLKHSKNRSTLFRMLTLQEMNGLLSFRIKILVFLQTS